MVSLLSSQCAATVDKISDYKKEELVLIVAGLLTLPELSANSIRLEVLQHLALSSSSGSKVANRSLLNAVLNGTLIGPDVSFLEDPQEDVFISNVSSKSGDYRIFNSIWEANDYFTQCLLDILEAGDLPDCFNEVSSSCLALLRISDLLCDRSGYERNFIAKSKDKAEISLSGGEWIRALSSRSEITLDEILDNGLDEKLLERFVLPVSEYSSLRRQSIGSTMLEKRPLIKTKKGYCLALPGSVGVAMRYAFLEVCRQEELLENFSRVLRKYQIGRVYDEFLYDLHKHLEPVFVEEYDDKISLSSMLLHDGSGQYFCSIVTHEDLKEVLDEGLGSIKVYDEDEIEAFDAYLITVLEKCKEDKSFKSLRVLISNGGLGRGFMFSSNNKDESISLNNIGLCDLYLLSKKGSKAVKEFLMCLSQKEWLIDQGMKIKNINGDINYYGFWLDNQRRCVPFDTPIRSSNFILSLYTDYVLPVRLDLRRAIDRHSIKGVNEEFYLVSRLQTDSLFSKDLRQPVYVSLEHVSKGILNGVVENDLVDLWLGVSGYLEGLDRKVVYDLWEGLISLLNRILKDLSQQFDCDSKTSVQIWFDFSNVKLGREGFEGSGYRKIEKYQLVIYQFDEGYLDVFSSSNNSGERELLVDIVGFIAKNYLSGIVGGLDVEGVVRQALFDDGLKIIHVFSNSDRVDYLLSESSTGAPVLINRDSLSFETLKLFYSQDNEPGVYQGRRECSGIFNKAVSAVWKEIQYILNTKNLMDLISRLHSILVDVDQDASQWFKTSRALYSSNHGDDEVIQVAQERDSNRNLTTVCARSLIEMAVCECPVDGGEPVSSADLERLITLCGVMIDVASDSDAIHWRLIDPEIIIGKDGSYSIDTDVGTNVIIPYMSGHFSTRFMDAVESYEKHYEFVEVEDQNSKELYPNNFNESFREEYGIGANELILALRLLIDEHLRTRSVLIEYSLDDLYILLNEGGVSLVEAKSLVRSFSLFSRSGWEKLPDPYSSRDIMPWKHKRRLSCLAKPLLNINDEIIVSGLILIVRGFSYLLDRTSAGEFSIEFFDSSMMRNYVANKYNERGAEFTKLVGEKLKDSCSYVKTELLMKSLGAPEELGDIDVLAFKGGELFVLECKNLQMAKTVSEIADVCNRFLGEEKDELRKHLDRLDWVKNNIEVVSKFTKLEIVKVRGMLITNTDVPMKYKSDLPIDRKDISSFSELKL